MEVAGQRVANESRINVILLYLNSYWYFIFFIYETFKFILAKIFDMMVVLLFWCCYLLLDVLLKLFDLLKNYSWR